MAVGAALRRHRIDRGLSATALARAVDISNGHLSDIERGRRNPSPGLLRRLEEALALSPGELQRPLSETSPRGVEKNGQDIDKRAIRHPILLSEATVALAAALGVSAADLLPSEELPPWPTPAHGELALLVALMLRVDPQAGIAARGVPDIALLSDTDVELIAKTVREALTWGLRTVARRQAEPSGAKKDGPVPDPQEGASSETSGHGL